MRRSRFQRRDRVATRAGEWLLFALARCFRWLTRPVPVWRLAGICAPAGGALAVLVPAFRRRAEANLELVRPDLSGRGRRRLVRAAGAEFTRLTVEFAHLDRFLCGLALETRGAEHLLSARDAGRGAVLVTAHLGNWEAARLAALRLGCETGIIYRALDNRYLDRAGADFLRLAGRPVLRKGPQGMRQLVRHVGQGGSVLILVDQRSTGAPLVDFLGHPAETATTAAALALKTGAALIPVRTTRDAVARRFEVEFGPPVTGDDPLAMMAEVNRRLGAWIEERPEQWFWFHRRWRRKAPRRKPEEMREWPPADDASAAR